VLGCADGTLRIFTSSTDPTKPSATLNHVVCCIEGAPSTVCWLSRVQGLLTIEPTNKAHPAARLYLNCCDALQFQGADKPILPRAVHLPASAGCKPGLWYCHKIAASSVTALSITIPTARIPVRCAATHLDRILLAGAGGILVYHIMSVDMAVDVQSAALGVRVELLCAVHLAILPQSVSIYGSLFAVMSVAESFVFRLRADESLGSSTACAPPDDLETGDEVLNAKEHVGIDGKHPDYWQQMLTLPRAPSALLSSAPFHASSDAGIPFHIAPTITQQILWLQQASESSRDINGMSWSVCRADALSQHHTTNAVRKVGMVLIGGRARPARVEWVFHGRDTACGGLHTTRLLPQSGMLTHDEGLGREKANARQSFGVPSNAAFGLEESGAIAFEFPFYRHQWPLLLVVGVREAQLLSLGFKDIVLRQPVVLTRCRFAMNGISCHACAVIPTRAILVGVSISSSQLQLWPLHAMASFGAQQKRIIPSFELRDVVAPAVVSDTKSRIPPMVLASYSLPHMVQESQTAEAMRPAKPFGVVVVPMDWALVVILPVREHRAKARCLVCAPVSQLHITAHQHICSAAEMRFTQMVQWQHTQHHQRQHEPSLNTVSHDPSLHKASNNGKLAWKASKLDVNHSCPCFSKENNKPQPHVSIAGSDIHVWTWDDAIGLAETFLGWQIPGSGANRISVMPTGIAERADCVDNTKAHHFESEFADRVTMKSGISVHEARVHALLFLVGVTIAQIKPPCSEHAFGALAHGSMVDATELQWLVRVSTLCFCARRLCAQLMNQQPRGGLSTTHDVQAALQ